MTRIDIMLMSILGSSAFLLCLGALAYSDHKKREIPNVLVGVSWIVLCIIADPSIRELMAFLFGCTILLITSFPILSKNIAWGDILMFVPYVAFVIAIGAPGLWISLLILLVANVYYFDNPRGTPQVTCFFLSAISGWFVSIVSIFFPA